MRNKFLKIEWLRGESNPGPKEYKKATLPLSYDAILLISGTLGSYELLRFNSMKTV